MPATMADESPGDNTTTFITGNVVRLTAFYFMVQAFNRADPPACMPVPPLSITTA